MAKYKSAVVTCGAFALICGCIPPPGTTPTDVPNVLIASTGVLDGIGIEVYRPATHSLESPISGVYTRYYAADLTVSLNQDFAVIAKRNLGEEKDQLLLVGRLNEPGTREVSTDVIMAVRWSNDGKRLAVVRKELDSGIALALLNQAYEETDKIAVDWDVNPRRQGCVSWRPDDAAVIISKQMQEQDQANSVILDLGTGEQVVGPPVFRACYVGHDQVVGWSSQLGSPGVYLIRLQAGETVHSERVEGASDLLCSIPKRGLYATSDEPPPFLPYIPGFQSIRIRNVDGYVSDKLGYTQAFGWPDESDPAHFAVGGLVDMIALDEALAP